MRRIAFLAAASATILGALLAPGAAAAGKNLVDNPSFAKTGDDPVPDWRVRNVAGKTSFRVEDGKLVVERGSGFSSSADECVQILYLPQDTLALRLRVVLELSRVQNGAIALHFRDKEGAPLGRLRVFPLSGSRPAGTLERDVPLPEGTKDAELSITLGGRGRIDVDEVDVREIAPDEVRAEARIVQVFAAFSDLSFPRPAITETQCIVRQERAEVRLYRYRVVVTERDGFRDLPETIPVTPGRHLPRSLRVVPEPPADPKAEEVAKERLQGVAGMRELARRVASAASRPDPALDAYPGARAEFAAAVFRAKEVPARPVALVPIGGEGVVHAVEVATKDQGWLRFGLGRDDPRPLPFARHVRLERVPTGAEQNLSISAEEVGAVVLPPGAGPDLVDALTKAWTRSKPGLLGTTRASHVDLRGKAKKLAPKLRDILGSDE